MDLTFVIGRDAIFKMLNDFETQSEKCLIYDEMVNNFPIFCLISPIFFADIKQQGKSEGFDSCDRPSNLTQIGFKSSIFQPLWPWNLMDDPKKQ